ncbi:MAG: PepSY domain-containing protein [Nitrospira sp.]|nr:MAG: PepSY domain-containing protein [Nitrospira sp.]
MSADDRNHQASSLATVHAWRHVWLKVHLYLGMSVGALLVVFGLTGSVLVFWQELDEWFNHQLLTVVVPVEGTTRPLSELIAVAERTAAADSRITAVFGAPNREGVCVMNFRRPSGDWQRIYLDPYQPRVTGTRKYDAHEWVPAYFLDVVFKMHYTLLLGENGRMVTAICALSLLVSLSSGLVVWWPVTGHWRRAMSIKWSAHVARLHFDLHQAVSLYTFIVLGAVLLSGVYMNVSDHFLQAIQWLSPGTRGSQTELISILPSSGARPIGPERAWAIVTDRYPEGEFTGIYLPESATGVYLAIQRQVPGLSAFWAERTIAIDQYSGAILDVRDPTTRRSAGETFLDWQWPLHSGRAFGLTGRLVVFLSGLACPVIYATGVLMWWRRRRRKQRDVRGTRRSSTPHRRLVETVRDGK